MNQQMEKNYFEQRIARKKVKIEIKGDELRKLFLETFKLKKYYWTHLNFPWWSSDYLAPFHLQDRCIYDVNEYQVVHFREGFPKKVRLSQRHRYYCHCNHFPNDLHIELELNYWKRENWRHEVQFQNWLFCANLIVTRFFMRLPKSEYPRCIGGRFWLRFCCWRLPSKLLAIGELGSLDCLSTKIGLG